MKKIIILFIMVSLAGGALLAAGAGEQLVMGKCGTCHMVEKLCTHLGKHDAAGWAMIVDGMVKKGAKINGGEKQGIAAYLAGLKGGEKPICK